MIFKTGEKFSHVSKFGIEVLSLSQIVMVLDSNSSLVHNLKKSIVTNFSSCLPRYVLMVAYIYLKSLTTLALPSSSTPAPVFSFYVEPKLNGPLEPKPMEKTGLLAFVIFELQVLVLCTQNTLTYHCWFSAYRYHTLKIHPCL